ncbi:MAG TPA: STAS domain-containing protein [Steroidobacteraceae bacterium]|nr:STAS domain-containing protein [Steroidobacteraceae bacterium]
MAAFEISAASPGRLEARGAICYDSAARALQAGLDLIPRGQACTIDLSKVTEADSAGLAVLVEWLATARKRKSTIHYEGIPAQILAVARISDLDDLLTDGK